VWVPEIGGKPLVENGLGQGLAARKCPTCRGDGVILITVGNNDEAGGSHVEDEACPTCRGSGYWLQGVREANKAFADDDGAIYPAIGFTVSKDLGVWLKAAIRATHLIFVLSNGGPGYRCDIGENRVGGRVLATGWSTGWSTGWPDGFELDGPAPQEPDPLEALWRALMVLKP